MVTRVFFVLLICGLIPRFTFGQAVVDRAAIGRSALTGHYVGTAISKTGQLIPVSLDIMISAQGGYSGAVTTAFGVFSVSGRAPLESGATVLALSGESGKGTLRLSEIGGQLSGSYTLADDSGSVSLRKMSEGIETAEASRRSLKTPIMFLGVYHMANPELDAVSFVADDALAPARQAQIQELVAQLRKFHPTKVLVEAPYTDVSWQSRYEAYLHGTVKLGANEIEQIGFRIAEAEHLPEVNGIDYQMFLNGLRPDEIRFPGHAANSQTVERATTEVSSAEEQALRSMTISQYLARINSPESLSAGQQQYMGMLLPDTQPALYGGADLVAAWYKRNLRIFENINRFLKPGDQILVIIGAGHVPLLREFATESCYYRVVDPLPFLAP